MRSTFSAFATRIAVIAGSPVAFSVALGSVVIWGLSGPFFRWSDEWQIAINTGTTIVTFLMIFVLQHTANRDGAAIQVKLDELVRAVKTADNEVIGIQQRSDEEIQAAMERVIARVMADPPSEAARLRESSSEPRARIRLFGRDWI
jgi:low affinity Fe/Cu permease